MWEEKKMSSCNKFHFKYDVNDMIAELFQQGLSAEDVHNKLQEEFHINIVVSYLQSIKSNVQ